MRPYRRKRNNDTASTSSKYSSRRPFGLPSRRSLAVDPAPLPAPSTRLLAASADFDPAAHHRHPLDYDTYNDATEGQWGVLRNRRNDRHVVQQALQRANLFSTSSVSSSAASQSQHHHHHHHHSFSSSTPASPPPTASQTHSYSHSHSHSHSHSQSHSPSHAHSPSHHLPHSPTNVHHHRDEKKDHQLLSDRAPPHRDRLPSNDARWRGLLARKELVDGTSGDHTVGKPSFSSLSNVSASGTRSVHLEDDVISRSSLDIEEATESLLSWGDVDPPSTSVRGWRSNHSLSFRPRPNDRPRHIRDIGRQRCINDLNDIIDASNEPCVSYDRQIFDPVSKLWRYVGATLPSSSPWELRSVSSPGAIDATTPITSSTVTIATPTTGTNVAHSYANANNSPHSHLAASAHSRKVQARKHQHLHLNSAHGHFRHPSAPTHSLRTVTPPNVNLYEVEQH